MARRRISSACPGERPLVGPVRTCAGCRKRVAKSELLRVVAGTDAQGHLVLTPDPEAVRPGRGAYLHPTSACLTLAERRRVFGRALRVRSGLDLEPLRAYLDQFSTETQQDTDNTDRSETGANSS